jgi:hypothetical protein
MAEQHSLERQKLEAMKKKVEQQLVEEQQGLETSIFQLAKCKVN